MIIEYTDRSTVSLPMVTAWRIDDGCLYYTQYGKIKTIKLTRIYSIDSPRVLKDIGDRINES